jgi:hypothetical protein
VEQIRVLARYLGEWIFVINDDDTPVRCWSMEQEALAELQAEGWRIADGPGRVEPDVPTFAERNTIGYKLVRGIQ